MGCFSPLDESFDRSEDVLLHMKIIMAHPTWVVLHGNVLIGVSLLISLDQMPAVLNANHLISLAVNYQEFTGEVSQLILVIEVLFDQTAKAAD